jgi:hypothetical protein
MPFNANKVSSFYVNLAGRQLNFTVTLVEKLAKGCVRVYNISPRGRN